MLLAAVLRLRGIAWDAYNHYHPDERFITWVATSIEWPERIGEALEPRRSTLNPYYWPEGATSAGVELPQGEPRRFAYGHLPLYLSVVATRGAEWVAPWLAPRLPDRWTLTTDLLNSREQNEFRHITAVGRLVTGLVDIGTVWLVYMLGARLFRPTVGLLAAALLAVNVMHIQLAHFLASDPYLTFFVTLTLLLLVIYTKVESSRKRLSFLVAAGAAMGLAVGSKFTGVLLLAPMGAAVWLSEPSAVTGRLRRFLLGAGVAALTFALTNPFAVLDLTCTAMTPRLGIGPFEVPSIRWRSCYLENIGLQATMVRGLRDVPFVRQYAGTTPYLYFVEMQLRWGMGPLLGLTAFAGLGWAVAQALRRLWQSRPRHNWRATGAANLTVLLWAVPFFVTTGGLDVKFMRYLQPLMPVLMVYAAALLLSIRAKGLRRSLTALVLLSGVLFALAFSAVYSQTHPWNAASAWFYRNVAPSATIVSETWDDPLPQRVEVDGQLRWPRDYDMRDVNWLSGTGAEDDIHKLSGNLETLAEADYVVIASNRNYGVIPRLPGRYPLSSQYHALLFDQSLGFELSYAGTRTPSLFGLRLLPDRFGWPDIQPPDPVSQYLGRLKVLHWGRADESFTVYDQPLVMVFVNRDRLSAAEMLREFELESQVSWVNDEVVQ